MLKNDLDGNGVVTADEATRTILWQRGGQDRLERELEAVMRLDIDNDGRVTFAEALTAARNDVDERLNQRSVEPIRRKRQRLDYRASEYLAIDPNGDGQLTLEELKQLG